MTMKKRFLNLSLAHKVYAGFAVLILIVISAQYFSSIIGHNLLKHSIGSNSLILVQELMNRVDRSMYRRIEQIQVYSKQLTYEKTLIESNVKFDGLDHINRFINEQDKLWVLAPKEEITPFMREILYNELSTKLRKEIELKDYYTTKYGYLLFGEIFVTNKYGANVAQTGKTTDYYQGDEKWWQMAKEKGLYIENVDYDKSADIYAIDIAVKIIDEKGDFAGVIKAVINIEEVIKILQAFRAKHKTADNRTRQLTLLTDDRRIIYSTKDFKILDTVRNELTRYLEEDTALDEVFFTINQQQKELLTTHAHSHGFGEFKGLGWILIFEQDSDEIFAPVIQTRNILILVTFFIVIIVVLILVYSLLFFLRPIRVLKEGMEEVGRGQMDREIEIPMNDEIGQLTDSFNKMTRALKETTVSKNYLDNIIQSMTDSLFILSPQGFITGVNRSLCALLGYKESELTGAHLTMIFAAIHDFSKTTAFDDLVQQLLLNYSEMTLLSMEGKEIPVLFSGSLIHDSSGKAQGILCLAKDISDYKIVEKELYDIKMRAQVITDTVMDGIIMINGKGNIIFWNPAAARILGYEKHEAVGKELHSFIVPNEYYKDYEAGFKTFTQTGKGKCIDATTELTAIRKGGDNFPVEFSLSALMVDGEWHTVGIIRDITERKRSEKKLRILNKAFETTQVGFTISDMAGTIKYTNNAEAKMHGYTTDELIGKDIGIFVPQGNRVRMASDSIVKLSSWKRESVNIRKDGAVFPVHLMTDVVTSDEGRPIALVTSCEDITIRKEMEEKLKRYNRDLEEEVKERTSELSKLYQYLINSQEQLIQSEKMVSIGQLAAGIAHELNNPLGFVHSNLRSQQKFMQRILGLIEKYDSFDLPEIVKSEIDKEKESINYDYVKTRLKKIIESSIEGAYRMKDIIHDLKTFSRVDTAKINEIDINKTIDTTLGLLIHEYKDRIEIIKDYSNLPLLCCYGGKINQVLMNILLNACQAIEGYGEITIKTETEDRMLKISIKDTGKGIAKDIQARIFEPFFTTKPVGKGTGLGLSITYGIVKEHKGELSVQSEEGNGTMFVIKLPLDSDLCKTTS